MARSERFELPTLRFVVCFSRFRPAYALYDQVLFWAILCGFYLLSWSVLLASVRSLVLTWCLRGPRWGQA